MTAEISSGQAIKIRRAEQSDSLSIRALVRGAGINPTGLDWRRFSVAVDGSGGIIGSGQIKPHRDGSKELASIAVASAWQNQGVATAIIEHLLANHPGTIYLTCRRRLENFYARFGFTKVVRGSMPPYFRRVHGVSNMLERLQDRKSVV